MEKMNKYKIDTKLKKEKIVLFNENLIILSLLILNKSKGLIFMTGVDCEKYLKTIQNPKI